VIVTVDVAVALSRPPREDRWSRVMVDVPVASDGSDLHSREIEAEVLAIHMASSRPGVVMAVRSEIAAIEL